MATDQNEFAGLITHTDVTRLDDAPTVLVGSTPGKVTVTIGEGAASHSPTVPGSIDCAPLLRPIADRLDRLMKLLALSEVERNFVRDALASDADQGLFGILADYLEDRRNPDAARFRRLAGQAEPEA
jgi:hypothetical protein